MEYGAIGKSHFAKINAVWFDWKCKLAVEPLYKDTPEIRTPL